MNARYTAGFRNLRNENLKVTIYTADGGDLQTIQLGANGVTTDMDNSDDVMQALRSMSGYLYVINDGRIDGIVPNDNTEHYVEIVNTESEEVLFAGYMQAQQFDKDAYLLNEEMELPIVDSLGAMDSVQMNSEKTFKAEKFADLLLEAVRSVEGIEKVMYPQEWMNAEGRYYSWLELEANRGNFFNDNDDDGDSDDAVKFDTISYMQLLDEIAKLMGWTVMQSGRTLCFMTMENVAYEELTLEQLESVTNGQAVTPATDMANGVVAVRDLIHSGADNTLTQLQGCRKVEVECEVNAVDDIGIALNCDLFPFYGTWEDDYVVFKTKYLVYRSRQKKLELRSYVLDDEDDYHMRPELVDYEPRTEKIAGYYIDCQIERQDTWRKDEQKVNWAFPAEPSITIRANFNDVNTPGQIDKKGLTNDVCLFVIKGGMLQQQTGGCLDLTMNVSENYAWKVQGVLKIGKYWLSDTGWSENYGRFTIDFREGKVLTNKTIDMPYGACDGFVIPLPDDVYGEVRFEFWTLSTNSQHTPHLPPFNQTNSYSISDISIKYVESLQADFSDPKTKATYSRIGATAFKGGKKTTLMFATKTPTVVNGLGILMYKGKMLERGDIRWNGQTKTLEEVLLEKMLKMYTPAREILTIRTRTKIDMGSIMTWNGKSWRMMSESEDWAEGDYRYRLIEIE